MKRSSKSVTVRCGCGVTIPEARLKAVPTTNRCVGCQSAHERQNGGVPKVSAVSERVIAALVVGGDYSLI